MYVVETSLGSVETMKITVINSTGAYWVVDVLPEFTVDKLKLMALSHFFNPIDSIKVSDRYKLILVSQNRPLPDESTIRDEEIRENGIYSCFCCYVKCCIWEIRILMPIFNLNR